MPLIRIIGVNTNSAFYLLVNIGHYRMIKELKPEGNHGYERNNFARNCRVN